MLMSKGEIQRKIFEYQDKIKLYQHLLKKGHNNPCELRNPIVDYKMEILNLKKMEAC